jgi:chromosome segregation ATPase
MTKEVKDMTEKHVSQTSNWEKGQSKVIAALKEKHSDEIQSHQKRIDILSREHFSLEFENTQCQRDLQSYQHRCTTLEKLIDRSGSESRDSIDKLLLKVNDVEAKLEASKSTDKESKSKVSILEDQLASLHVASNDKVNALKDTIKELRSQLDDMNEKNQTQLTRIKCLEEEVDAMQHDCTIEKQKMQQVVDQTVSEVNIICEALKVANKNEKIKAQHAEDLLRETTSLHESLLDQITTEKKELSTKLEKVILDEREVGKSLMNKVQELNSRVQHLTSEKYQLNHQANQHMDQIYNLEKVIANGELKVSQFAKQLTRSMQEQELQLRKEMELKKELNTARIEVEKMRKCHGHGARREIEVTSTTSDGSVDRR